MLPWYMSLLAGQFDRNYTKCLGSWYSHWTSFKFYIFPPCMCCVMNSCCRLQASRESIMSYYSDAGEVNYGKIPVSGDIQFGLDYNYKANTFEILVKQCRNLAPVDTKKNRSDPYVLNV